MNEIETRIPLGYEDLEVFLLHCELVSKSATPHFPREEAGFLYCLLGLSLKEIYAEHNKEVPKLIRIDGEEMEAILERIVKINPDILYN